MAVLRLGRDSIIQNFSEQVNVTGAGHLAKEYLATLWDALEQCGPPVSLSACEVRGGGVSLPSAIVAEPTAKRLRPYKTVHFAQPLGTALNVGFWLIGNEQADSGNPLFNGFMGIGMPTDADISQVTAIVELIRDQAVAPTIQHIADLADGQPRGPMGSTGFAGV